MFNGSALGRFPWWMDDVTLLLLAMDMIILCVGYLASVFLAISLLVSNDLQFRWINTLGCFTFVVYGVLIHAFPIIMANTILLAINIYYLIKIYKTEEDFDLIEWTHEDQLLRKFLQFHDVDIKAYFPGYTPDAEREDIKFFVLRDMAIANVFVARLSPDGTATVDINYTVPKYRDYQVGRFIFEKERKYLVSKGVRRIHYTSVTNQNHLNFMKKMGFTAEAAGYSKVLV